MNDKMSVEQAIAVLDSLVRAKAQGHEAEALATLRAELDGLRVDAERLDWLESRPDEFANIDRITSVSGKFNGLPSLRAAIDAAHQEKGHE